LLFLCREGATYTTLVVAVVVVVNVVVANWSLPFKDLLLNFFLIQFRFILYYEIKKHLQTTFLKYPGNVKNFDGVDVSKINENWIKNTFSIFPSIFKFKKKQKLPAFLSLHDLTTIYIGVQIGPQSRTRKSWSRKSWSRKSWSRKSWSRKSCSRKSLFSRHSRLG